MSWIKNIKGWGLITMRYFDSLTNLLAIMTGLIIVAIMFCNSYEVVMRYFFDSPTDWVMQVTQYSLLWIVSLTIGYTQRRGTHIRIDAVISRMSRQVQSGVGIVVSALSLLFFILFTWSTIDYVMEALRESWSSGPVHYWPLFPIIIIIPVGGFLMGLHLSVNIINHITDLAVKRQNS